MSVTAFDRDYVAAPGAAPLHARPRGVLAATGIGAAACVVLGLALVLPARHVEGQAPGVAMAEPDALPTPLPPPHLSMPTDATPVGSIRQLGALDLTSAEFAHEKKNFSSRQLEEDAGHEDSVTLGQFAQGGPYMRLDVRQMKADKATNADFFLDMTRHAREAGLSVAKIGAPSPLASRFGSFEAADIRLTQPASDKFAAADRSCLAARHIDTKASLEISSLACGAAAKPIDRTALGCILDRIDYRQNGENKQLEQFFVNAELQRGKGCGSADLSPNATKASGLDAHSADPDAKQAEAKQDAPHPVKHAKKPLHSAAR